MFFFWSICKLSIAEYGRVALTVIGGIPGNDIGVVSGMPEYISETTQIIILIIYLY